MKLISIFLLIMISLANLLGCSQPAEESTPVPRVVPEPALEPTPEPEPIPEPEPTQAPTTGNSTPGNFEAARQVVYEYWAAFNSYDAERALSYYEEQYREQQREDVENKISMVKRFHVTLTVEEVSEPVLISEGKVKIEIKLGTPIGPKYSKYQLIEVEGEWKICQKTPYNLEES